MLYDCRKNYDRLNKRKFFMQIIALINQKGGVGKTTCAINIGAGLNKLRKRVLLIDLDPQAHFNLYSLGVPAHELKNTVYELLEGTVTLKETIIERDGLSLVPSSLNLSGAEIEFPGLIDCPLLKFT